MKQNVKPTLRVTLSFSYARATTGHSCDRAGWSCVKVYKYVCALFAAEILLNSKNKNKGFKTLVSFF